jgi:hypothetical protein
MLFFLHLQTCLRTFTTSRVGIQIYVAREMQRTYLVFIRIDGSLVRCSMQSAGGKWSQREGGTQGQNLGPNVTELLNLKRQLARDHYQG